MDHLIMSKRVSKQIQWIWRTVHIMDSLGICTGSIIKTKIKKINEKKSGPCDQSQNILLIRSNGPSMMCLIWTLVSKPLDHLNQKSEFKKNAWQFIIGWR